MQQSNERESNQAVIPEQTIRNLAEYHFSWKDDVGYVQGKAERLFF